MKRILFVNIALLLSSWIYAQGDSPQTTHSDLQNRVQNYLSDYNSVYQKLAAASNKALWNSVTHIVPGDSIATVAANEAAKKLAMFTGSKENIEKAIRFLKEKEKLNALQVKQLNRIAYAAANNPQTIPDVVEKRIKSETAQNEKFFDFGFKIASKPVSANEIDDILNSENDLTKRQNAWEASKEVGIGLKKEFANLRDLRNQTVQALGYKDFFNYQVADYNMTSEQMVNLLKKLNIELRPLYRELHTYIRYELAKRYKVSEVPDLIPAHWLPNRWGQDWSNLVTVKGTNLDSALKTKGAEWMLTQGQQFYESLGFQPLPKTFWERSDFYPVPANAGYKKNVSTSASAWHYDLDEDVRFLMSIEPTKKWYRFIHHELAHIYNYLLYSTPEVPVILREGSNRAYSESMGSLLEMASMQESFLENYKLIPASTETEDVKELLREALKYVVFIPFSSGTVSMFEYDLYTNNLTIDQFNKRWWELTASYQGIAPPAIRDEKYCDATSKMHINAAPAQYYDYALSSVLVFQFHDYIAKQLLHQNPRNTNYYGSKQAGTFIKELMQTGANKDWKDILKEKTGGDLSAQPMLDYFAPLMAYLKKENKGRKHTLPEIE